jgi:hypothetical protein
MGDVVMKMPVLAMAVLMVAGSFAPFPVRAQNSPPIVRERAPGVPMAPQLGDSTRLPAGDRAAPLPKGRVEREERAQASRDLPMPRPVPSIIAP